MNEDPFDSIIKHCQISSSQEEYLRDCPFSHKRVEEETGSEQPTGIFMVSLPDSFRDDVASQEDNFHTPPENPRSQSISSSDDLGPTIGAVNSYTGKKIGRRGDNGHRETELTVDLGEDSDTVDVLMKKNRGLDGQFDQSASKKCRVSEENLQSESPNVNLGDTEPVVIKNIPIEIGETEVIDLEREENRKGLEGPIEIGATEVVDLECEKNCKGLGAESTVNLDKRGKEPEVGCGVGSSGMGGGNGGGNLASRNIDDLDKFKYVASGGIDKCAKEGGATKRRELPCSFQEPEENEGLWRPRGSLAKEKEKTFKDLLDDVMVVFRSNDDEDHSDDTDFLETAKKRGLTFPWPRWWPEGNDG